MDITKLYHCTSFGSLESILRSGEFWSSYCLEKADYLNKTYEFAFAIVCFADLMKAEVKPHLKKFNKDCYIQMSKTWAKRNGLSNVIYYDRSSALSVTFKHLIQDIIKQEGNKEGKNEGESNKTVEMSDQVRYFSLLMAYFKQYEGFYWNDNKGDWSENKTQFYTEREWRYIPLVHGDADYYLDPIQFKDKSIRKQKHDQLIKRNYTLKFGWNDIETIGVTNWSNKIEIVHLLTQNHSIRFTDAWNKIKVMQKWHF